MDNNEIPMLEMDPGVFPEPKITANRVFDNIPVGKLPALDVKLGFSDYLNMFKMNITNFTSTLKLLYLITTGTGEKMDANQTVDSAQKIANLIFPYIFSDTEIAVINKAVDDDQVAVESTIALVKMVETKFGPKS